MESEVVAGTVGAAGMVNSKPCSFQLNMNVGLVR